jgi:ribosomal protein S11
MSEEQITDSVLLQSVKAYIEITGEGRLAFIRELQSLAEQVAAHRVDNILSESSAS